MTHETDVELTPIRGMVYAITFTIALNSAIIWTFQQNKQDVLERIQDRYTATDAAQDFRLRDLRLSNLEQHIVECRDFMREHERDFHRNGRNPTFEWEEQ